MLYHNKHSFFILSKFIVLVYFVCSLSILNAADAKYDKNAVVKITNEGKISNMQEPFKIPENTSCVGSGLFIKIKWQIYILTNYHVIEGAKKLSINVPSLGKTKYYIDMENIGCYPERDVALIRLKEKELEKLKTKLGEIPCLELGDSDALKDPQTLTIAGWPLNSDTIQLSEGIFAGRDSDNLYQQTLHTTAAINPGNSGGPALDTEGKVVGICVSKIMFAEGMGYLIPINEVISILPALSECQKIRFPFWGAVIPDKITEETMHYLSNDDNFNKGIYVQNVLPGSLYEKYGIRSKDIIYEINGMEVDIHGYMQLPEENEKIHFFTYLNKIPFWKALKVTILRNKQEITLEVIKEPGNNFDDLKKLLPEFEDAQYEIIDGMVIMPLLANHLAIHEILSELGINIAEFLLKNFQPNMLIITSVLPDSECYETSFAKRSRILSKVNGKQVKTLEDLRATIKSSIANRDKYIIFENYLGEIIAIPTEKIVESYNELPESNIHFKSPIFEECASHEILVAA